MYDIIDFLWVYGKYTAIMWIVWKIIHIFGIINADKIVNFIEVSLIVDVILIGVMYLFIFLLDILLRWI